MTLLKTAQQKISSLIPWRKYQGQYGEYQLVMPDGNRLKN